MLSEKIIQSNKKGEVSVPTVIGAIIILVLIGILANIFVLGAGAMWLGSIISLDQIEIKSTSQFWNAMTWQALVIFDGNGQQLIGESIPLDQVIPDGYETDNQNMNMQMEMSYQGIRYTQETRNQQIYQPEMVTQTTPITYTCNFIQRTHNANECVPGGNLWGECGNSYAYTEACYNMGGVPLTCIDGDDNSRTCRWININAKADIFDLTSPNLEWTVNFEVETDGSTETVTSSHLQPTAQGSNLAVTWNSNPGALEEVPSETQVMVVRTISDNIRRLVKLVPPGTIDSLNQDEQTWRQWATPNGIAGTPISLNTFTEEIISATAMTNSIIYASGAYVPSSDWREADRPVQVSSTSVLLDSSAEPYFYPIYSFFIRASWLGIYIPMTDPSIASFDVPTQVMSNDLTQITAQVRNNGEAGAVDTILSCTPPVTIQSGNPYTLSLSAGETKTAYFTILGETDAQATKACTVSACDALNPSVCSASTTKTFLLLPEPEPDCGDGICEYPESNVTCPEDCKSATSYCADGTEYGECSTQKPWYCSGGTLVMNSQECGCPTGMYPQEDGTCGSQEQPSPGDGSEDLWKVMGIIFALVILMLAFAYKQG